ncbi:hypothetical protein A2291_08110 [candidate division WOR-1 bacterium RIFOXYB2_FULL_42_35]|uniref:Fido domain-containing protein n=1 Tax=candidate division WOR-1 bacterium RIFOXYC2_FULL_41_25 TaxID=1802586 RepID=A0A1F4TIG2_UNCSA|nr:MAG: hypothetical protein A2247_01930 [candidate division WOR-1 bacterium RIFOXYA2_FULL_41_14]OGC24051.1 MAG: hypothetical protein A2291_08110 [candidate division WOR-1 bacterium RIFOXYB2_FULL_42_35]OGC32474.1 MAG: hypothetical protein A2462_00210 [candidate division WOR-1 bacterium RIFOXYC2_FULL_41_25]OGC44164.1 MAG: hypothetical protein A2548_07685 [candidate division WOR-1 bacterium RIFOXYD2_FULL_41_8]
MEPAWLTNLQEQIKAYAGLAGESIRSPQRTVNKHQLREIIKQAVDHKQDDIYNSTTIEGYAISPEEVEAVIMGKIPETNESIEQIKNKMAIIGHANAFEFIIKQIKQDFGRPLLSEELVNELYFQLFKPSVDANILDRFDLVGYRRVKVYIRNSRFVPPAFDKVPDLVKTFISAINGISNHLVRAILAHYFFVSIHPYPDGNGRCARLLMNYLLACSGHYWVTIPAEKREHYFKALQSGQLDSDVLPFTSFILSLMA